MVTNTEEKRQAGMGIRSVRACGLIEKGTFKHGPQQLEKLIVQYVEDWYPGLRGKQCKGPVVHVRCTWSMMACLKSRKKAV